MAEKAEELDLQAAEEEEEEIEIELVDLQEITEKEKRLYDTALSAHERKNYAYGIDLLRTLLKKYPGLIEARMKLREMQMDRIGKVSMLSQALATVGAILPYLKVKRLAAKGNYAEALDAGEGAMGKDPTAWFPCIVLFRAAEAADVDAICLMALEQAIEFHPKSLQVLDWLAQLYSRMGMGKKALVCRQKIFEARPNDLQAEAFVKDAIAEAAMDEGGWGRVAESDGKLDYRSLIKDTSEAVRLEQQDRTVKGDAATDPKFAAIRETNHAEWKFLYEQDIPIVSNVQETYAIRDAAGIETRFAPFWESNIHAFQRDVVSVLREAESQSISTA